MEEVLALTATAAAKKAFDKGTSRLIDFVAREYSLFRGHRDYKNKYLDYLSKQVVLKTLVRPDQSFHVDDIYVPLKLSGELNTMWVEVNEGVTLDFGDRAVVLKGLAGQGKSTLLRKLLSNEGKKGTRFPLFYELKDYKGGKIESAIAHSMELAGIPVDESALPDLLMGSNAGLFLDAFDETHPDYRIELLQEIRKLINKYKCKLICTSRPDTELDSLVEIDVYRVAPLSEKQVFKIIKKTCAEADKSIALIDALKKSRFHKGKSTVLRSPILVVLFCASYNLGDEIPSTLSQFYGNIFNTIFFRHDNLKGRVNRLRHWNDDHRIYRIVFDGICFASQRTGRHTFSKDELLKFVEAALEYAGECPRVATLVLNELTGITNLIIEDGFSAYRFVHKSIQEFFSSSFVKDLKHESKTSFYEKCIADQEFAAIFSNTLFFLEEIDFYDYCEYFLVPGVDDLLGAATDRIDVNYKVNRNLSVLARRHIAYSAISRPTTHKRLGKGIEKRMHMPVVEPADNATSPEVMFLKFVASTFDFGASQDELVDSIVEYGTPLGGDKYELGMGRLIDARNAGNGRLQETVNQAVQTLFAASYNRAKDKLQSRDTSLKGEKFFEF